MTKEKFLADFDEINLVYNNANMKDSLERHIDELLESKKAKWEGRYKTVQKYKSLETYESFEGYFCSNCGGHALAEYANDESDEYLSRYCPWCGAKMEDDI